MARNESDREDLMAEAVSLTRRIEYTGVSDRSPILAGFNALDWLFVYVGHDVMYRFDESCRLRRAFVDGLLYRTEGTTLASLERQRQTESRNGETVQVTSLLRRTLSADELRAFRERMLQELTLVLEVIQNGTPSRQFPPDATSIHLQVTQQIQNVFEAKEFLAPAIVRR